MYDEKWKKYQEVCIIKQFGGFYYVCSSFQIVIH